MHFGQDMRARKTQTDDDGHHALENVIDALIDLGRTQDRVRVQDASREFGTRSFGPFLFVPAVLEMSPVGAVPGLPTFLAVLVALTALQLLFGRKAFWIPGFLGKRSISGERLQLLKKMRPVVRMMDRVVRSRHAWILHRPWLQVVAALCIGCAFVVPPLELFPFASTVPFAAIALIGLGIIGRDGLFVMLGAACACVAIAAVLSVFLI